MSSKLARKNWREKNKDKIRYHHIFMKYGLTKEQWIDLLEGQGSRCSICKSLEPGCKGGWHTDHCHITKKVRGILCQHCNLLIGNAKDSVLILEEAIRYLNKDR